MKQILYLSKEKQLTNKNVFQPIFKKLSKTYEVYTINQEKENVIVTKSGSVIHIPQRAFEHTNGNLLSGNIDIYYREIRTAADIIANGIDMNIKMTNGRFVLQTNSVLNKKIN